MVRPDWNKICTIEENRKDNMRYAKLFSPEELEKYKLADSV